MEYHQNKQNIIATSQAGETIDALLYRLTLEQDFMVEAVLARNPHLSKLGAILPAGVVVEIPTNILKRTHEKALWD